MMKCLLFLSVIVMIFVTGEAIRCYRGILIDKTFDSLEAESSECPPPSDACGLGIIEVSNGTTISVRHCDLLDPIPISNIKMQLSKLGYLSIKSACEYKCDTDLCNSAHSISSSSVIIFSTLVSILLAIKKMF